MKKINTLLSALILFFTISTFAQTVELKHDCDPGTSGLSIGTGQFSAISCYDHVELDTLYGHYAIKSLKFFMFNDTTDSIVGGATIRILKDYVTSPDSTPPVVFTTFGDTIYTADVLNEITPGQWTEHVLTDSIPLEAGHSYAIALHLIQNASAGIMAYDNCPMVPDKGGWIVQDPAHPNGVQLNEFTLDFNFCIRAIVEKQSVPIDTTSTGDLNINSLNSTIYPNPANSTAQISFSLKNAAAVSIAVFNNVGQLVKEVVTDKGMQAGSHLVNVNTLDLPSGLYSYRLECSGEMVSQQFAVIR